jgi:hypothetical protein
MPLIGRRPIRDLDGRCKYKAAGAAWVFELAFSGIA